MNNDKMSKSKGNMLYGDDLVRMFGLDAIRYYLLSEMGYQNDGNISYDAIISRTNIDLANIYGNLVSRTASMIKQYFGGIIPAPSANEEVDTALIETVRAEAKAAYDLLDKYYLSDAATHIIALLKACNKYIDDTTPWMLAKDESKRERLQSVMAYLVEGIRTATTLFTPYMPTTAENVAKLFGFDTSLDKLADFKCDFAGNTVGECGKLFARIDKAEFDKQLAKEAEEKEKKALEGKIDIEDFAKVSLVVGKVVACEPVPKSDKLLKLSVDIGSETRTVASGIAKFYKPNDLVGKKIILVENLKPAMLRGVKSEGMILASGEDDVKVVFIDDSVPVGSKVR
mgnify:FL=1